MALAGANRATVRRGTGLGGGTSRRVFLRALSGAALALLHPARAAAKDERRPVLVCLNLAGGLDGLSLVVPYGEDDYYRARPQLALPPAGKAGGALPLDSGFGLHPKLEPLYASFLDEHLAIVHAVGGKHFGRSHFRARQLMHSAAPAARHGTALASGWANRYAQARAGVASGPRLYSTLAERPAAFAGAEPVALSNTHESWRKTDDDYLRALHDLYEGAADPFARAAETALAQAAFVRQRTQGVRLRGHYSRAGRSLREAARLILANVGAEIVWVELDGFDSHRSQGSVGGSLARRLSALAQDLAAFRGDLGHAFDDVVLVTMTEFGRTLHENGAGGTDHGSACCSLVLGGPVRGGRLLGSWPGLSPAALCEGRDLAVTTDYRAVLAPILTEHLGLAAPDLAHVFPGFSVGGAPLDLLAPAASRPSGG